MRGTVAWILMRTTSNSCYLVWWQRLRTFRIKISIFPALKRRALRFSVEMGGQGNADGLKETKTNSNKTIKNTPTRTKKTDCIPSCLSEGMLICVMLPFPIWTSEGNCREHLISLMPFRNVVGFDRLEQTVSWHSLLSVLQGLQNGGKPNSRAKVPELDQQQHLGNISLGPRRTCSTWEMGYISFARWELPLLLSWDNPVSSGVCGY